MVDWLIIIKSRNRDCKSFTIPLPGELFDFIRFLESKVAQQKMETAVMSESAHEKNWLKPEEDEAWKDL